MCHIEGIVEVRAFGYVLAACGRSSVRSRCTRCRGKRAQVRQSRCGTSPGSGISATTATLTAAVCTQYDTDGLKDNGEVEGHREVLQVKQVVLEFAPRVVDVGA